MSETAFPSLSLNPALLRTIADLGYQSMTPVQAGALPPILQGQDVIARAKTGSGKTAAFALGLLQQLDVKYFRIQALVLCPTRELADQVASEIRRLGRLIHNIKVLTLCGGVPFGPQIGSLEHGAHIVVGTPGRLEDHLRKGNLKLENIGTLVLDEADRMLEMGFQPALDAIIAELPEKRQTLLFSATFPEQIESITRRIMLQPVMVNIESQHDNSSIEQHFYRIGNDSERMMALRLLLHQYRPESALVFCNTRRDTQALAEQLQCHGFSVLALHGDLEQKSREQALVRFANRSVSVLVATDVAARGLDIDALDIVFNYHLARDDEVHVHRIGRTGRAGSQGIACSFYTDKERFKVDRLEGYLYQVIESEPLPGSELLQTPVPPPVMATLEIDAGKKQKIRPGDILGALTGENGIDGKMVGKINIFDQRSFVAVQRDVARPALDKLADGKIKGRSFKIRRIRG